MDTEVPNQSEQNTSTLVSGIVNDFQDLVKQQLRLTRQELEADVRHGKDAASFLAVGGSICLIGAFALCLMLAHLFHWLGAPPGSDPAAIPLWICYALAGGLFVIAGALMMGLGRLKFSAIGNPLHQTTQALKENLEWKTKTNPS
jgi:hypothetical protein